MLKISLKDYKRFLKILRNLLDIYGYLSINDVKKIAIHYAFTNIDEDTIKQTFKLLAKKNGATLIDAKYIFSREVKECYKIFKSIEHLLIPFDQFIADSIKRMDELLINIPNYLILEESKELLLYSNTKLKTWMRNNIDQKLHLDKEKIESFLFFSLQTAETLLRLSLLKNNTQIINILYTYKILNREDHDGIKIQNLANIVLKILNDNKIWICWRRGWSIAQLLSSSQNNDNFGVSANNIKLGDISKKACRIDEIKNILLWAIYTHGVIPLENVIDIFKNVKGFYYDVPSKEEIKNIVNETPYQDDGLHTVIYQDCLCAYMFNKKTHEIKLDANEFVEWFKKITLQQKQYTQYKKLDTLDNYVSGLIYPKQVSAKWDHIMNVIYKSSKTQFTEEIERIFENELDYIKHSECPIEESYERICIIYQNVFQKQINYSDKILIMALLNELNNEIPKWGQKGYSLNELNKN